MEAINSIQNKDGSWITTITDKTNNKINTIRSKVIINATGPFADHYNNIANQQTKHNLIYSKGAHIITSDLIGNKNKILSFFADDGRLFFVIPINDKLCIGTTDTITTNLKEKIRNEDIQFIIDNFNNHFKLNKRLELKDIISYKCGFRALAVRNKQEISQDWLQLSRKHILEVNNKNKYVTIFGGKLTDCINIGNKIINIINKMGLEIKQKKTKWFGEETTEHKKKFMAQSDKLNIDNNATIVAGVKLSKRLWRQHQMAAFDIITRFKHAPQKEDIIINNTNYTKIEIEHCAKTEMIVTLEDFLRRRTQIEPTIGKNNLIKSKSLINICKIIFKEKAQQKLDEYIKNNDEASSSP